MVTLEYDGLLVVAVALVTSCEFGKFDAFFFIFAVVNDPDLVGSYISNCSGFLCHLAYT